MVKTEKHNSTSVAVYVERDIVGQQTANRGTKNNSAASIFVGPKKYHHS